MEDFTIILGDLIDDIDLNILVEDVQADKVFICKTLHLRERRIIEDELGNKYKVLDVLNNVWITVEPIGASPNPFEGTTVVTPPLTYIFGTPSSTDGEYQGIEVRSGDKTPLIWLWENYRERQFGKGSSIEREVNPRIFFLDETKRAGWSNEDHHKFAIQPMMNLIDEFLLTIRRDRLFKRVDTVETIPRVRFGKFIDNRGDTDHIIDEFFSGVEMQPLLIRYKDNSCKDC